MAAVYGKHIIKPLYHTIVETIFLFDNKKLALNYKNIFILVCLFLECHLLILTMATVYMMINLSIVPAYIM